jgi:hypothetical protein
MSRTYVERLRNFWRSTIILKVDLHHKYREAVASNMVRVVKILSSENKCDPLTKPMGPQDCYRHNRGVIFKRNGNEYIAEGEL